MSITVENLRKEFHAKKKKGRNFLWTSYEKVSVPAVKDISFQIPSGERVAFIGPNGAGKSTTLKMLSGILKPTDGRADVVGFVPWEKRRQLAYHIGLVFGQRSQLWYHLPVRQSFELLGKIYGLETHIYKQQLSLLEKAFSLSTLLDQPVKALSLGQRMRCEIVASLLHKPKILFLDEPTIGLDVITKAELRTHLRTLSEIEGTTLILTSHDTADIEEICNRVILINHGEKLIDTTLVDMKQKYLRKKQLIFITDEENPQFDLSQAIRVEIQHHKLTIEIDPIITPVAHVISQVLGSIHIRDVIISDIPLEEVIKHIYRETKL